jgi:carbon monoxide dehydrogenase subunit G
MAIEIQETFQVRAPIDAVWRFVMDPQKVVTCMPGAALEEVVDERTFLGSVKVKVGAITTTYRGRVQFAQIDAQAHVMQMTAEGRETGGGMAKGTMSSRLRALPDGHTEVVAEASVDLTGRIMQVGRGMIQGVAHQLFLQFVAAVTQRLEVSQPATGETTASQGAGSETAPAEPQAIRIVPLLLRVIWSAITRFFRGLFGRPPK